MKKQTNATVAPATKKAVKKAVKVAAPATKKAVKKAVKVAAPATKKATKKAVKVAAPVAPVAVVAPARETKKGKALEMLVEGATIFQLMETFGWLRHTTRGFLSILGKTHKLETFKNEKGEHTYKLGAA
jgi:hypothetical protein